MPISHLSFHDPMNSFKYPQVQPLSLVVALFIVFPVWTASSAHAQEEARAAWQVTRFDITANLPSSVPGASAERALTSRVVLTARNVGQAAGRTFTVRISGRAEITAAAVGGSTATFRQSADERTKLQRATITLPGSIAPGATVDVTIEYRLPVPENGGLAAISLEGSQFLPLSLWYPTPNTAFASRGADTAAVRLTVNAPSGETVASSGQASGQTFEQKLSTQPFFLTGKWEMVEGSGDGRGTSAWLLTGATADERRQAEALIGLASAARLFYAGVLGPAPDTPIRLVAVRRGAGFSEAGTVLLNEAAFRRAKVDSATALLIAEAIARVWVGGATPVRGEGSGAVREGLSRYLALLFLEKQFGLEVADVERMRGRVAYAAIARRDAPLSQSTPLLETHYTASINKGAQAWRLVERLMTREAFLSLVRSQLQAGRETALTLAALRQALVESGGVKVRSILDYEFDQVTDMDLLVGQPQQRAGEATVALRNTGALEAAVTVRATTESGERLTTEAIVPAKDFSEARFRTPARIMRVEVDPDKFYPQLEYGNDVIPRTASVEDAIGETARLLTRSEYAQVDKLAREALIQSPRLQEVRITLARSLLAQNKFDEAEKEFRSLLDDRLPSPSALAWAGVGLGEIALRRGQAAEAAKRFDEAVRADAESPATLAARAGRLKAEAATGAAPAPDEAARSFIAQLDQAVRGGRKAEIDALVAPGELTTFSKGIVGSQPEVWQTRVLRTELLGGNRLAADVSITAKVLGRDQAGTAVFILTRTPGGWKLADVPDTLFEVR